MFIPYPSPRSAAQLKQKNTFSPRVIDRQRRVEMAVVIMLMLLNQIRIFPLHTNAELRMALFEVSLSPFCFLNPSSPDPSKC